jgi:hypothetical protein
MPETRQRAVTSSTMSTIRPPVVTGFGICDETVSSCTVEKKNASQRLWIALWLTSSSNSHIRTVPTTSTTPTSTSASSSRRRRAPCGCGGDCRSRSCRWRGEFTHAEDGGAAGRLRD